MIECEKAVEAYHRGGPLSAVNKCEKKLNALTQELWRVDAGRIPDYYDM
jgi:hypothetical protein